MYDFSGNQRREAPDDWQAVRMDMGAEASRPEENMTKAVAAKRRVKVLPAEIFGEYYNLRTFNDAIGESGLYAQVEQNENFFIGEQWKGVNAPDLDKPVVNILKRVVSYQNANLVSDDIGVNVKTFENAAEEKAVTEMLAAEFDRVMEQTDFKRKNRDVIRNASVDGDACLHFYWEPGEESEKIDPMTGMPEMQQGHISGEIVENTNVYFGNPQICEVQKQPYLILAYRRLVDEAKEQAEENGCDASEIFADTGEESMNRPAEENKVTVLRKYWKERGHVWYTEVTAGASIKMPTDSGLKRYPLAWMCWEKVKNSYHGQASITGLIPNQIFINKLFAMSMQHVKMMAFPTVVYNSALIRSGWNNRVGACIGVRGDPNAAVASSFKAQDMSQQVLLLIDKVIQYTRDTMGASDASLGNIKPDNTSAIIATQQATSMPLELQKMDYYAFVEDCVRIWLDMMAAYYGERVVLMRKEKMQTPGNEWMQYGLTGEPQVEGATLPGYVDASEESLQNLMQAGSEMYGQRTMPAAGEMQIPQNAKATAEDDVKESALFDFAQLRDANLQLNVDIGAATYWSELQQVKSLDGLLSNGILTDGVTYLENMPDGYIPNKQRIIDSIKRQRAQAEAMQQQAAQMAAMQNEMQGQNAMQAEI